MTNTKSIKTDSFKSSPYFPKFRRYVVTLVHQLGKLQYYCWSRGEYFEEGCLRQLESSVKREALWIYDEAISEDDEYGTGRYTGLARPDTALDRFLDVLDEHYGILPAYCGKDFCGFHLEVQQLIKTVAQKWLERENNLSKEDEDDLPF